MPQNTAFYPKITFKCSTYTPTLYPNTPHRELDKENSIEPMGKVKMGEKNSGVQQTRLASKNWRDRGEVTKNESK